MPDYPIPGTRAAQALEFVRANPGCSQNAVTRALRCNPSSVVEALGQLQKYDLIEVRISEIGYKQITAL